MFELFHSPKTVGSIPPSPVSLLFRPSPNLSTSGRQACAAGLRNTASRRVIRDGLVLLYALKLPRAVPRCWLHFYDSMSDSAAHYEEVENERGLENTDRL
jgi:hypothetical protein